MKNLKQVITTLLLVGLTQIMVSQTTTSAKIGVKGGVNFSNLYVDNVDDNNMLTGFNLGLFAKVPITKFFSVQPEIYYTGKGSELTYNNFFATGTAKFKLNYIEVPVLAVINITESINIHAGPYMAYLINGKVTNESNVTLFNFANDLKTEDFNRFDAGLAVGAGLDFDSLSLGVRYNYGLSQVGKERNIGGNNFTYPDGKNSVFNIYAAFSFN